MTVTRWPRILWVVGSVLLVTMLVHLAAIPLTGGALLGPVSLHKPATFAETGWLVAWSVALLMPETRGGDLVLPHAIGAHALTLLAVPAVLLARTSAAPRRRLLLTGTTVAAVVVAEAVLLANALAVRPLSALPPLALAVLGLCALALLGAYAATTVQLWRDRPPLTPAGPSPRQPAAA